MLGAKLAHDVRPFARRGDPDRAAALAIGEAQRGQYASRRSIAHGVEERLYRLVEAAPVGHLAFGHRPRAAATAGEADIKVRTIVERHVDPGRHCGILRCKAFGRGTRPYPRLADRPATPPMMKMPSRAAITSGKTREAVSSAAVPVAVGCLVDRSVMISPSALHPRAVKVARRRPVYWLSGLSVPSAFPKRNAPVASNEGQLSAYSCGGSRGLELSLFTAFPSCVPLVMREPTTIRTIDWSCAAASPNHRATASPLTSLAAGPLVRLK